MLIVVFGTFRGVWVINEGVPLRPHVSLINDRWHLIIGKGYIWQWMNNRWSPIDTVGLFYLGHNDSDGDGREEMYFFYKSGYYPDTFYISGSCAIR